MSAALRSPSHRLAPLMAGLAYFVIASIALLCSRFEGGIAFIWAANALLMAELQTSETRHWPRVIASCAVASLISTALFGMGLWAAVPMAIINIAESLIVALLCRRFIPVHLSDGSRRSLLVFIFALCIPANMVAATGAALMASVLTPVSFGSSWLQWYSGHVLGGLVCTPILTMLLQGQVSEWVRDTPRQKKLEIIGLLFIFLLVVVHVFFFARYPLLFLLVLPLVTIAFRTGSLGAAASIVLLALVGGGATITGHGPIALISSDLGDRTQLFQLFLALSFLLAMPLAAELNGRRRLFQTLLASEARYRAIAEHCGDVVLNISVDGIIQYASPSSAEQIGCAPALLVGRAAEIVVDPQDRAEVNGAYQRALARPGDVQTVEFRPAAFTDGADWCEMVTRAMLDEQGLPTGVVSTIRDMSRHKARQRALQRVAAVDTLTGADSRWAFLEKLDQEIQRVARGAQACLLLIDIDHFKSINDRYGHGVGDQVLSSFVERLRPGLRGGDSIGRLGGEEFAILLAGEDIQRASRVCERLRDMVSARRINTIGNESITVTFSAGLVELKGRAGRAELLDAADKALYRAKNSGRNCLRLAA